MSKDASFRDFNARLRAFMLGCATEGNSAALNERILESFDELSLELFRLQYHRIPVYRRFCDARGVSPEVVSKWREIPAIPTTAFKEFEISSLLNEERTAVFHSSGTTGQRASCHFHSEESLAIYEMSLLKWFRESVLGGGCERSGTWRLIILTPSLKQAPHSSLVHMFETVKREFAAVNSEYVGDIDPSNGWVIRPFEAIAAIENSIANGERVLLLGTAFTFVHLLDHLEDLNQTFSLPAGSQVMETGGYKGRSRVLSRQELHDAISRRLGISEPHIVSEYGMSELSSQAYARAGHWGGKAQQNVFVFPAWVRARIVSGETGEDAGEGEMGLIQVFDLANVRSVMAIQTEDLGIPRGDGFELLGRTAAAEARGCSLMTA